MNRYAPLVLLLFLCAQSPAEDWLAWRGPSGDGQAAKAAKAPLKWSKDEHVKWHVELDGPGNSTPIVVGKRVFITHSPKDSQTRGLRCYDRTSGDLLWKQEVEYAAAEPTHETNPYCSASPVSDGKVVVAWFGSAGLHCYDLDGKQLWQVDTGKVEHIWGYGSSPMLYEDLVIQQVGPGLNAYVAAYKLKTGEQVWRKEYAGMKSSKIDEFRGSWSTPVLHRDSLGRTVLLLSLPETLRAVSPATGEDIWSSNGPSPLFYTSPITTHDIVVAMCGYGGPALATTDASMGDVAEANRLWIHPKGNPQRVGSGVAIDGAVFILNENGVALCLDAKSGETKWEKRLSGAASWSSMTHVAGRLYVPCMSGKTVVLAADPSECKVLAENEVGEMIRSSLAFSGGEAFLRTYDALYCIGADE
jgi:outer membrane protein assembly factor BamB